MEENLSLSRLRKQFPTNLGKVLPSNQRQFTTRIQNTRIQSQKSLHEGLTNNTIPIKQPIRFSQFKPKTKSYIQLSPSTSLFDLRGKDLQKDIESLHKAMDIEKLIKKTSEIHCQLKNIIAKNTGRAVANREDLQKESKRIRSKPHKFAEVFFKEIRKGNIEKVEEMLRKHPGLVNEIDSTGQTALHWACRRGFMELFTFLLRNNARTNIKDIVGRMPEDIARTCNNREMLNIIIMSKRISRQYSSVSINPNY